MFQRLRRLTEIVVYKAITILMKNTNGKGTGNHALQLFK